MSNQELVVHALRNVEYPHSQQTDVAMDTGESNATKVASLIRTVPTAVLLPAIATR